LGTGCRSSCEQVAARSYEAGQEFKGRHAGACGVAVPGAWGQGREEYSWGGCSQALRELTLCMCVGALRELEVARL
jgi:hypothetical protein